MTDNNEISPDAVNAPVQSQKDTKPKRQRPAVEDLYDLSKPIPKVRLGIVFYWVFVIVLG
jgi:hypothetical protein